MVTNQIVDVAEMRRFLTDCLTSIKCDPSHAADLVDLLVEADHTGHYSHGLNRIQLYLDDIEQGVCKHDGKPEILKESVSTAFVDGKNLLGPVIGKFCMDLAIKKAKQTGIGCVSCKGSNHFGIGGYYSSLASQQKLIGMSFTNGSPLVVSTNGRHPFLSTNPLSVSASGKDNTYLLDMATSAVSYGKVEMQERKGEPMPPTWAVNKTGHATTDPKEFHALLPLGGFAETSGYKGYGIGIMVELMAAILSGSAVNPNVRSWKDRDQLANLGHCFIAIDPTFFAPNFDDRLDQFAENVRAQEPADPDGAKVLFPGDPEMNRKRFCDQECKGIPYHPNQMHFANKLAKKLNITPPHVKGTMEI